MKPLPLHFKASILASTISLVILSVGMIVASGRLAKQIQDEETQIAALQAENLAEQLSLTPNQFDTDDLQDIANIVSGSRPNLYNVRIWKLQDGNFTQTASSDDSLSNEVIDNETRDTLVKGVELKSIRQIESSDGDLLLRVYSPVVVEKQVVGAVEVIEKLDAIWSITWHYASYMLWILVVTVALMAAAFYVLFQKLIYSPVGNLLEAMEGARTGDLSVELGPDLRLDEFGLLSNNFNSMMTQIRDMTAERESQNELLQKRVVEATAELRQKNDQLELSNIELLRTTRVMSAMERLAAAGQTAAQFAHEVGTPLNLISGHTQLLQSSLAAGPGDRKRLKIIADQIDRIEKIVHEMLDRTRFGISDRVPVDINALLRKTIAAMEPTIADHKVILSATFSGDLPDIQGDSDRLQQVFLNLFNNAIDATPTGGGLKISTSATGNKVLVEFSDSGAGMTDEISSKIFQPLFTTKERGRGTGLGLYVVKQILDEHGAEIHVESKSGIGTIFRLYFSTS
ncbi:MAG: ATP-binding protein [Acidobacteriota bacterium]